jgi:ligand-binding sensor protein
LKRGDGKAGVYTYKKDKEKINISNDETRNNKNNERINRFKSNNVNNVVNKSSSSEKS